MKKLASAAVLFMFISAGALAQPPSETPQPPPSAPETAKPEAAPPPPEATQPAPPPPEATQPAPPPEATQPAAPAPEAAAPKGAEAMTTVPSDSVSLHRLLQAECLRYIRQSSRRDQRRSPRQGWSCHSSDSKCWWLLRPRCKVRQRSFQRSANDREGRQTIFSHGYDQRHSDERAWLPIRQHQRPVGARN